jgi:hypothetical protein
MFFAFSPALNERCLVSRVLVSRFLEYDTKIDTTTHGNFIVDHCAFFSRQSYRRLTMATCTRLSMRFVRSYEFVNYERTYE